MGHDTAGMMEAHLIASLHLQGQFHEGCDQPTLVWLGRAMKGIVSAEQERKPGATWTVRKAFR